MSGEALKSHFKTDWAVCKHDDARGCSFGVVWVSTPVSIGEGGKLETFLLAGDEEVGGSGQVAMQMLGGPYMSLGRLGHSRAS